jgi:hypothetical protein
MKNVRKKTVAAAAAGAAGRRRLGLAPLIVRDIFSTVERLRADGVTILLVEQNARARRCRWPTTATCWRPATSCCRARGAARPRPARHRHLPGQPARCRRGHTMKIEGQSALVTGGGSGLGEAVARELARQGARVAVLDVNALRPPRVAADIGGAGLRTDITESASLTAGAQTPRRPATAWRASS